MNLFETERLEMMRKRHAYFSAVAEEGTSHIDVITGKPTDQNESILMR